MPQKIDQERLKAFCYDTKQEAKPGDPIAVIPGTTVRVRVSFKGWMKRNEGERAALLETARKELGLGATTKAKTSASKQDES